MTIDEAIKHAEEVAEQNEKISLFTPVEYIPADLSIEQCQHCADEHRQLVEWLKELKQLKEQQSSEDCIRRQTVLEQINCWIGSGEYRYTNATDYLTRRMQGISPVTPQPKTGKWIKTPKAVMGEGYMWYCDKCEYQVYQDSSRSYPSEKYCPNCGVKMEEVHDADSN